MAMTAKSFIKGMLTGTPYRISRNAPANRFQAIEESLRSLSRRGYSPGRVIDCGANLGSFTRFALGVFPRAVIHAIEPQTGCQPDLLALTQKFRNRVLTHAVALCGPNEDGTHLAMETDESQRSTGAHVTLTGIPDTLQVQVPCFTLDTVLAPYCKAGDQALLKLDLQGYELQALRGAIETLTMTDVILAEVSFYAQAYEPPIADLFQFLTAHGFDLHDVASIYARPRDNRPRQGDFLFVRRGCDLAIDSSWS